MTLFVHEIFLSIQGETSLTGKPFVFVRLTGCNLRCVYCDTAHAFYDGKHLEIDAVLNRVRELAGNSIRDVLLTGGEPLLQKSSLELVERLVSEGFRVSIETHGEVSIEKFAPFARIILDIKTPGSGISARYFEENLRFLKKTDEVKFVLARPEDYEWAKDWVLRRTIPCTEILFSAAVPAAGSPGQYPGVGVKWLAEKILKDRLPVRMQTQLHKIIWGADARGV